MRKFECGLLALCMLIGSYVGSMFGIGIAICTYMILSGLIEEMTGYKKQRKFNVIKKEEQRNA